MARRARVKDETSIIQDYFAPIAGDAEGALGLRDDAALISPPDGMDLIVSTDSVVAGVHFLTGTSPYDIAWKALAVNVSDIVAKGAEPALYLMNLSLPEAPDDEWMREFSNGLAAAQKKFGCVLTGGDTDQAPGPISVTITLIGYVPKGEMVKRSTAQPGDVVFTTGLIGEAGLGLKFAQHPELAKTAGIPEDDVASVLGKFYRPQPNVVVARVLRDAASAAMDVSDGLVIDFTKMCAASDCGGRLDLAAVPVSEAADLAEEAGQVNRIELATAGEDYVVLGTVPQSEFSKLLDAAKTADVSIVPIGQMQPKESGCIVVGKDGNPVEVEKRGWVHFPAS